MTKAGNKIHQRDQIQRIQDIYSSYSFHQRVCSSRIYVMELQFFRLQSFHIFSFDQELKMNINNNIKDKKQNPNSDTHNLDSLSMQESDYNPLKYGNNKNKISKRRNFSKKSSNDSLFNKSFWTLEQNSLYRQFLIDMGHLFEMGRTQRKQIKINVLMSKLIASRNPDQCRSHHQKMMKYHNSIPEIIAYIEGLEKDHPCKDFQDEIFHPAKLETDSQFILTNSLALQKLLSWEEIQRPSNEVRLHLFDEFLFDENSLNPSNRQQILL